MTIKRRKRTVNCVVFYKIQYIMKIQGIQNKAIKKDLLPRGVIKT